MLTIAARWTVWLNDGTPYIHIQVPGHKLDRDYGTTVDIVGLDKDAIDAIPKDKATQSFNNSAKTYNNCTLLFDGSPVLSMIIGAFSMLIPIDGNIFKWLIAESKIKGG